MAEAPTKIRALKDAGTLEMTWESGKSYQLPFKYVRGECPCASCIEEWSGRKILNLDTIPAEIQPKEMAFVGNYALKITWNDGHNTGLYTWEHLWNLCQPLSAEGMSEESAEC